MTPDLADVPVEQLLAAVTAIPGVRDARIRTADSGELALCLDIADGVDEPVIVQRVSQLLQERLGITVDIPPRHVATAGPAVGRGAQRFEAGPRRRILLDCVRVEVSGLDCEIEVVLVCDGVTVTGSASGAAGRRGAIHAASDATVLAVQELLGEQARASVDFAGVVDLGTEQVVLVLVTLAVRGDSDAEPCTVVLPGVAAVRDDHSQAAARATLNALNRRAEALVTPVARGGSGSAVGAAAHKTPLVPVVVEPLEPGQHAARHRAPRSEHVESHAGGSDFAWYNRQLPAPRSQAEIGHRTATWE